jgi:hypothetical protein
MHNAYTKDGFTINYSKLVKVGFLMETVGAFEAAGTPCLVIVIFSPLAVDPRAVAVATLDRILHKTKQQSKRA